MPSQQWETAIEAAPTAQTMLGFGKADFSKQDSAVTLVSCINEKDFSIKCEGRRKVGDKKKLGLKDAHSLFHDISLSNL